MFHTKVVQKIKTHILCSVSFFLKNRTVYEKAWESVVEPDRPQVTLKYGGRALHAG